MMTATQGEDSHSSAVESGLPAGVLARLAALPMLATVGWHAEPLTGGLTNVNAKLVTDRGRYVARLSSETGSLLAIDRDAEVYASRAAAATGVAPPVVAHDPDGGVLVIEWVEGRTFTEDDVARQRRTCPASPPSCAGCTPAHRFAHRLRHVRHPAALPRPRARAGFRLPDALRSSSSPQVAAIEAALAVRPQPHGAVQQRPAGRQLHRRRGADLGSSTTSTRATTTRASSWATSGASRTWPRSSSTSS